MPKISDLLNVEVKTTEELRAKAVINAGNPTVAMRQFASHLQDRRLYLDRGLYEFGLKTAGKAVIESSDENAIVVSWAIEALPQGATNG